MSTDSPTTLAPVATTYRVPRVNLMPPAIAEAHRFRRTQAGLAGALLATVVVVAGGYVVTEGQANQAADDLATSQSRTQKLQHEQAKYADVPKVIAQVDAAKKAKADALAQNVAWYGYLNDIALYAPANVWVTNISVQMNPAGQAPAATNPLATPGVGQITVTGQAMDHPDVAAWLDMLATEKGLADPYFSSSAKTKIGSTDVVGFTSTATVTSAALDPTAGRVQ